MSACNPCIVIIFNHKYDKNIEVLEELYGSKFDNIFFLVPFYSGDNPRVIPVYESSFYFQGYIAQGLKTFFRKEFTHYLFIGDDLILNPKINKNNYADLLNLSSDSSYIPELITLDGRAKGEQYTSSKERRGFWSHTVEGVTFYSNRGGSETAKELPSYDEAVEKIERAGLVVTPLSYANIFGPLTLPKNTSEVIGTVRKLFKYFVSWRHLKVPGDAKKLKLRFPLVYAYSDMVVISAVSINKFCHLCGVFSAMGLFVEMAIPTALLLSSDNIVTDKETKIKGEALWGDDIVELEKKYNLNLGKLLNEFPEEKIYYHPVKLSRWK